MEKYIVTFLSMRLRPVKWFLGITDRCAPALSLGGIPQMLLFRSSQSSSTQRPKVKRYSQSGPISNSEGILRMAWVLDASIAARWFLKAVLNIHADPDLESPVYTCGKSV
jgi:hypothetical protein